MGLSSTPREFLEALDNGAELERAADEEEAAIHVPKRRRCGGHQEREGPVGPAEAGEWRDPGAPQLVLKAQSLLRRVVPYTTGEVLATILAAQNHLAEWNAGLWGTPVHFVEDEDEDLTGETSLLPTQPLEDDDPTEEPVGPLPAPPKPETFGANAPAIGDPWCGHGGPETGDVETAETLPWTPPPAGSTEGDAESVDGHRRRRCHVELRSHCSDQD